MKSSHLKTCPCADCALGRAARANHSVIPSSGVGSRHRMVLGLGQDDDDGGDDSGDDETDDASAAADDTETPEEDDSDDSSDDDSGPDALDILSSSLKVASTGAQLLTSKKTSAAKSTAVASAAGATGTTANPLASLAAALGTTPQNVMIAGVGLLGLYLVVNRKKA